MIDDVMPLEKETAILTARWEIASKHLDRKVAIDTYVPAGLTQGQLPSLLLINDGQNMDELGLVEMLGSLLEDGRIHPVVCVGIHAGEERKMEYGTAAVPDYMGRGAKAELYTLFVFEELLPFVRKKLDIPQFKEKTFAGFSLGGLSALDIVWAHPHEFTKVGVFSGALWWRSIDQDDPNYDDDQHRIMHQLVREGEYAYWLKFFFETGTLDETNDRNNNGIIDSIDDTVSLMEELARKGYDRDRDMVYLELANGRHDVETWAIAMPVFLEWAFGRGRKG
nr:alpha/beta hydrolase-fold protein [Flavihumibacter rivuli]